VGSLNPIVASRGGRGSDGSEKKGGSVLVQHRQGEGHMLWGTEVQKSGGGKRLID